MKSKNFTKERDRLISGEQKIPTHGFIKQFIDNFPDENIIPEEFLGRDAEEYYSWGYALFGYWTNAESLCHQLQIFHWMDLYASLERDDLLAFEEAVIEILNLEEKMLGLPPIDEYEPDDMPIPEGTLVITPGGLEARIHNYKEENNLYMVDFGNGKKGMYGRHELKTI